MAAALGATLVGLLGVDGGILWVVVAVWTVRSVWGAPSGIGWGVACLGAALRWGTLSLGDVEAASRLVGPGVAAGPPTIAAGMAIALVAATLSEARVDGLRAASPAERAVSLAAILALVALFLAPGPGDPSVGLSLLWWAAAAAALVVCIIVLHDLAERVPGWITVGLASGGVLLTGVSL